MQLNDPTLLKQQAYINGQWISGDQQFAVTNPATGEVIAHVPDLGQAETQQAIEAAEQAWGAWRKRTAKDRANTLRRWYELVMANQEDLAVLMTAEQGKPLKESRGEIAYGASFIEWFAEEAKRIYGDIIPAHGTDKRIQVIREPIGIAAAITPWNFPNAMITRKCAPAMAAGCPVIVKPAEDTPLSALALAELADRAGIPAGIFNIITSKQPVAVGGELTSNGKVRKLSFTGSTQTGKLLMRQCADNVKKVSLELGGNAPFIVFDDADLDAAIEGAMASKYRNAGQTCVCANRLLVQAGIYDKFVEKLAEAVQKLTVGHGLEGAFEQGPLINQAAVNKISSHIEDALAKGGRLICGGQPHALGGTFFEPTIIADVTPEMLCAREETFGPLAPVFKFETEEQAVAMANDTEFGLAAYFYTRDYARIYRVSEGLEYGMVAVNEGILSTEVAPFGGVKESGIGREGSRYGIEEYLEMKYICIGGIR
ncbi:succinate-semialdehyde dehydrogenase / glutarate-semialdehyde dehydrogenase [Oceanospirillum multiglobuliferum]|uniref:Succinate-semialdehyde dehydrogenase (NADP(+)) n=1 Tax=Oceanospirillum multiglobuliferum TaxID=64969 RepID=A0A1T4QAS8_9GAMM|nr:NAD-dependent succinate-semialdehyde dehydrogenase [Oceanospirillum multiglobuliferum]OPX56554.1 succinate-semialdehyde dehydrogenase (NADP(+)) [Oceanospirillum multiglobuliferum]SKA00651.1 succinate-semialdehyde dehydrogenase / glutarate-semialdehyde dehydrogenase [Oceanospirillum multiglobuliferum]